MLLLHVCSITAEQSSIKLTLGCRTEVYMQIPILVKIRQQQMTFFLKTYARFSERNSRNIYQSERCFQKKAQRNPKRTSSTFLLWVLRSRINENVTLRSRQLRSENCRTDLATRARPTCCTLFIRVPEVSIHGLKLQRQICYSWHTFPNKFCVENFRRPSVSLDRNLQTV